MVNSLDVVGVMVVLELVLLVVLELVLLVVLELVLLVGLVLGLVSLHKLGFLEG